MDNLHLSDFDEDSAMNCLNPRGRKGNFVFDKDENTANGIHEKSKEVALALAHRASDSSPMLHLKPAP